MTAPLPTEPLLLSGRLAAWAQQRPLEDPEFARIVIDAVSTLLRQYGRSDWTMETLPRRASDIGYIVAKDYYLNPRQLRQETTGPLQESLDASVLRGINLTEEQQKELALLANGTPQTQSEGLWVQETTRGRVETHRGGHKPNVTLFDTRGGWPIEYLVAEEGWVFFPEETA